VTEEKINFSDAVNQALEEWVQKKEKVKEEQKEKETHISILAPKKSPDPNQLAIRQFETLMSELDTFRNHVDKTAFMTCQDREMLTNLIRHLKNNVKGASLRAYNQATLSRPLHPY
jgi:hypothetical protein